MPLLNIDNIESTANNIVKELVDYINKLIDLPFFNEETEAELIEIVLKLLFNNTYTLLNSNDS